MIGGRFLKFYCYCNLFDIVITIKMYLCKLSTNQRAVMGVKKNDDNERKV